MNAATASPMSSSAIVAESLTHRLAVQATNRTETTAAAAAAAANGRQLSVPRPLTVIVRGMGVRAGFCCTGRAYAAGLFTPAREGREFGPVNEAGFHLTRL